MTDFTNPRTWTYSELVTAALLNTHLRDNLNALWVYSAAGQIALSTANNQLTVLDAASNANKKIVSNGTTWIVQNDTRYLSCILNPSNVALVTGDNAGRFRIPADLDGFKITYVAASRISGTGVPNIQLRNVRTGSDILSTPITIDTGETDSSTAATPPVINTANNDVSAADQIAIDVDGAGTNSLMVIVQIGLVRY